MKLTIEIADATVLHLVNQYPNRPLTDVVADIIQAAAQAQPTKPILKLAGMDSNKKIKAAELADELLAHVLSSMDIGTTFRPRVKAAAFFGDRLPNDRGLRSSLGIYFGRAYRARLAAAAPGAKIIRSDSSLPSDSLLVTTK